MICSLVGSCICFHCFIGWELGRFDLKPIESLSLPPQKLNLGGVFSSASLKVPKWSFTIVVAPSTKL